MSLNSRTVRIHAFGGPEQLVLETLPVGKPGPSEVCIVHHAIGLNFIDVYQRTGLYPNALPLALGFALAWLLWRLPPAALPAAGALPATVLRAR